MPQTRIDMGKWGEANHGEASIIRSLIALGVEREEVELQFPLGPYRLDFAFVRRRVAIESDGWVHTSSRVAAGDRRRDKQLEEWGWHTFRIDVEQEEAAIFAQVAVVVHAVQSYAKIYTRIEETESDLHRIGTDLIQRVRAELQLDEPDPEERAVEAYRRLSPGDRF